MKAEAYLARIIQRDTNKSAAESKQLARRIASTQVVRAIKEGPDITLRRRSYVN